MQPIVLKPLLHRGGEQIGIFFEKNTEINNEVRQIKGIKWTQTHKCWYVPMNNESMRSLQLLLSKHATINTQALESYEAKKQKVQTTILTPKGNKPAITTPAWKLSKENLEALQRFVEQLKLKAYSTSTIKTYRNEFLQLLQLLNKKPVNHLKTDDLRRYFIYCFEKLKLTENTLHSRINAIKFYFEQVLRREPFFWEIPRPKKQLQLPKFFNRDEITAIIKAAGNIKHKTMLMLAYSSGLRVSEVVSIKTKNIDSKRMCILIGQAKGKKDRMVMLSPVLLIMLREYWKKYKTLKDGYLFEGQIKGEQYSTRSLQLVLATAKRKAGILKPGSIHALRHSFATHLLDKGTDVTIIMKLLGHNDIKTTLRYLHVTNKDMLRLMSPLDELEL
jgi:integrase/recombinase XerD